MSGKTAELRASLARLLTNGETVDQQIDQIVLQLRISGQPGFAARLALLKSAFAEKDRFNGLLVDAIELLERRISDGNHS